jgi:hypothetical protein
MGKWAMPGAYRTGTAVIRNINVTDFNALLQWQIPRCFALVGGSRMSGRSEPAAVVIIPHTKNPLSG